MTVFINKPTPLDLYLGRMVSELLKDGGVVTIEHHGLTTKAVRFSYHKRDWGDRACLAKDFLEIDMARYQLDMADYDAEDIIREHNRPKDRVTK